MNLVDWKKYAREMYGYEMLTTFGNDFDVADTLGADAVRDTFRRVFAEWRTEYKYLTELVMVLNWKSRQHYQTETGSVALSQLYADLWEQADAWACDNLQGAELEYFYRVTD